MPRARAQHDAVVQRRLLVCVTGDEHLEDLRVVAQVIHHLPVDLLGHPRPQQCTTYVHDILTSLELENVELRQQLHGNIRRDQLLEELDHLLGVHAFLAWLPLVVPAEIAYHAEHSQQLLVNVLRDLMHRPLCSLHGARSRCRHARIPSVDVPPPEGLEGQVHIILRQVQLLHMICQLLHGLLPLGLLRAALVRQTPNVAARRRMLMVRSVIVRGCVEPPEEVLRAQGDADIPDGEEARHR
mmetsp:Transcript_7211/g.20485  ORF Transcript_7211/g.20485 Transcript_7211/m.20485 type:complete len:241 (-) Transcript_7211:320-1042(-)